MSTMPAEQRLIPEDRLTEAIEAAGGVVPPRWWPMHSPAEELNIAELRLLLGLPADTDKADGELFVRLVRRLVLVERALDDQLARQPEHCPCCAHRYAGDHVSPLECPCATCEGWEGGA